MDEAATDDCEDQHMRPDTTHVTLERMETPVDLSQPIDLSQPSYTPSIATLAARTSLKGILTI